LTGYLLLHIGKDFKGVHQIAFLPTAWQPCMSMSVFVYIYVLDIAVPQGYLIKVYYTISVSVCLVNLIYSHISLCVHWTIQLATMYIDD
jgi:hypothetical protein